GRASSPRPWCLRAPRADRVRASATLERLRCGKRRGGAGGMSATALAAPAAARSAWWQRLAPLLGLFLLCLVLSLASPYFLTRDNLLNVLRQSTVNAVLALGQLVVLITAGIDLSIGSVVGLTIVILTLMMRAG